MKPDRRWRHSYQVVRHFRYGALGVCCSHRWYVTAEACAWRRAAFRRDPLVWAFSTRETPGEGAA